VDLHVALRARAAKAALAWAEAEGWNPGLDDEQRFLAADPDSFLATERDGEVVATVSCALYGDAYAFIGFYIVRSDLRGRGIGSRLFDRALARDEGRVVGLDGVLAPQASYERRGFVLAHRSWGWRHRRHPRSVPPPRAPERGCRTPPPQRLGRRARSDGWLTSTSFGASGLALCASSDCTAAS
jgi:GNAT superfamily N-acetyltransferase